MRKYAKAIRATVVFATSAMFLLWLVGCSFIESIIGGKKSGDILPHLISEEEKEENPVRPIDSLTKTRGFTAKNVAAQYDELLDIVYAGGEKCRPDFTDASDEVVRVYNAAVRVLNRYIRNDFTEYERVHAIHDYLSYFIKYDFDLLQNAGNASGDDPAFRLDGVFVNGKAVCDGFSKAFLLLCGIEQIRCIRITGLYNMEGTNINHAWNKVQVDGVWYNVDTTMDAWHVYTDSGDTPTSLLCHGYFLISDDLITEPLTGRHVQSGKDDVNYECTQTYDFYRNTPSGIGTQSMEVTSGAELNELFEQIKKKKRAVGKIELKLNFPEYDKSNLARPDAYASYIAAAYKKVSDTDFVLDAENGTYPYQRYPDGVFVFLIYK